jgi:hypothetical protein
MFISILEFSPWSSSSYNRWYKLGLFLVKLFFFDRRRKIILLWKKDGRWGKRIIKNFHLKYIFWKSIQKDSLGCIGPIRIRNRLNFFEYKNLNKFNSNRLFLNIVLMWKLIYREIENLLVCLNSSQYSNRDS